MISSKYHKLIISTFHIEKIEVFSGISLKSFFLDLSLKKTLFKYMSSKILKYILIEYITYHLKNLQIIKYWGMHF